jgi:hypothetical protein
MTDSAATATTDTTSTTNTTNTSTASNAPWYGTVDNDTQNWLNSKAFGEADGPTKMLTSYRNMESLFGKIKADPDRVILFPKDMNNQEEVAAFREKIGVPKDINGYNLKEVLGSDPDVITTAVAERALKAGVPKEGLSEIIKAHREETTKLINEYKEQNLARRTSEIQEFEQAAGRDLEQKKAHVTAALKRFPQLEKFAEAIEAVPGGAKDYLSYLAEVGKALGEHTNVGVGSNADPSAMSSAAAKEALGKFNLDPIKIKALFDESHPGHAAAKAEYLRLNNMAY